MTNAPATSQMQPKTRPNSLSPPYTLDKVRAMLASWSGVLSSKLPADVAIIGELYEALREAGRFNEHLADEVRALENFMDRLQRMTLDWPDEVARDPELQAMSGLHREIIRQQANERRECAKRSAANLARVSEIRGRASNGNGNGEDCIPDSSGKGMVGIGRRDAVGQGSERGILAEDGNGPCKAG